VNEVSGSVPCPVFDTSFEPALEQKTFLQKDALSLSPIIADAQKLSEKFDQISVDVDFDDTHNIVFEENQKKMLATVQGLMDLVTVEDFDMFCEIYLGFFALYFLSIDPGEIARPSLHCVRRCHEIEKR
jgi:hypothetical protein